MWRAATILALVLVVPCLILGIFQINNLMNTTASGVTGSLGTFIRDIPAMYLVVITVLCVILAVGVLFGLVMAAVKK